VKLFTEALYAELLPTNVRVTVVFPGAINTNIATNSGVEVMQGSEHKHQSIKMLAPSKAAHIIIDGIEQNRYRVLVGRDSVFMDFLYRVSPKHAARFIAKQMRSLLP
jgi:short-subunit dehydrogenase